MNDKPQGPVADDKLNDSSSVLTLLATRRSASVKAMGEPGPSRRQLDTILAAGARVPDHGKLAPWRFIVFEGEARGKFGDIMAARWRELNPGHGEATVNFVRGFFERAPVVVAVVSTAAVHPKIPVWEQQLSAGAVCQNMLLAATALGLNCQWNTDWCAYDEKITAAMGLGEGERVAGLIYIGTTREPLSDRPRPDVAAITTWWRE